MRNRYKYPKDWNSLRMIIIIRDKFCCQICGKHENDIVSLKGVKRSLHVMHLDGNTRNNKYTLDGKVWANPDNNLASGCPECHRVYDKQFPINYNNNPKHKATIVDMNLNTNNHGG